MKNTKIRLIIVGILSLMMLAVTMFQISPKAVNAQQCAVIRIYGTTLPQPQRRLEPETLLIEKGTCAIWFNWGRDKVRVIFRDAKKCEDATSSPTNFVYSKVENCYVTSYIPLGGTSSLLFDQPGTYEYEVIWGEKAKEVGVKGKIVVLAPEVQKTQK